MLFITSPAKRLDFTTEWNSDTVSKVVFNKQSEVIAKILKNYSVKDLSKKLYISQKLAELNYARFQSWDVDDNSKLKPAILAYQGDVYKALNVNSLDDSSLKYLQGNFRILTGMYGILKPNDLIQAYRLEMKIKLGEDTVNNLYDYWTELVTRELNKQIEESSHEYVINLASQEYSKVIDESLLSVSLINIKFTQLRDGNIKSIGILNKRARGQMLRFVAETNAKNLVDISKFRVDGYRLEDRSDTELVFLNR